MREQLSISPAAWLSGSPIVISNPTSIMAAFQPGTMKVVKFVGPHKLYRAAGWDSTRRKMASAYGSWWADELELIKLSQKLTLFEKTLPKELIRKALPAQYRGATALCEDWNDMREMFQLVLPLQQVITGLVGLTAPQPQKSTLDPNSRKTPMLQGGAEQVYFKKSPVLNSINPLWVHADQLW